MHELKKLEFKKIVKNLMNLFQQKVDYHENDLSEVIFSE
jgi:hypothetical protein